MDNSHSLLSPTSSEPNTSSNQSHSTQSSAQSDGDQHRHSSNCHSQITKSSGSSLTHSRYSTSSTAIVKAPPHELTVPWSDSLQTVLDQPPANFPKVILAAGITFSALFLIWAWFGRIQEVGHAQGQLISQGGNYKVQALVSGEVDEILVEEGDKVEQGEIIAHLDSHIEEVEIERLEESIAAYQLQLLQTRSLISQTQAEKQVRQSMATSEIQAQQARLLEAEANAATTVSLLEHVRSEAVAHQERLERIRPLVEEGAIAEDAMFDVEQSLREREQSITSLRGEMEKNQAQLNHSEALLEERQAEGRRIEIELQQRLQSLEREASELEAKIVEARNLLKAAQTRMEQMVFYAPNNGYILDLSVQRVGEMVEPGETLAEIAPAEEPIILSAALPNQEAGLVEEGMNVNVKLDAFPYQDYGVLSGIVSDISPNTELDEQLGAVYRLEIVLEQNYVTHEGQQVVLRPGQTAKAEVVVRRRRIIDILFDPIRKLRRSNMNL